MTTAMRKAVMVAATVGPLIFLHSGAYAAPQQFELPSSSKTAKPSPKPSKRKPPTTAGTAQREGLRLKGTTANQAARLGDDPPPTPKPASPAEPATHPTPPRERKAATAEARRDFKLNIGVCGLTQSDGTMPGPTRCQPFTPDEPALPTPRPQVVQRPQPQDVAWVQILTQYQDVLFPKLSVKVQPAGRTLVNLDTIVYTDESTVTTNTVTLLGFPVVVGATPMSYSWNFGDGSSPLLTSTPGRPYPSKEITHKYLQRGEVGLTLTTNYAARFNVAGTGWQYVDGMIPVTGPVTPLQVREAVPVLVNPDR